MFYLVTSISERYKSILKQNNYIMHIIHYGINMIVKSTVVYKKNYGIAFTLSLLQFNHLYGMEN